MKIVKVKDSRQFIETKVSDRPLTKSLCSFFRIKHIKVSHKIKLAEGDLIAFRPEVEEHSQEIVEEY